MVRVRGGEAALQTSPMELLFIRRFLIKFDKQSRYLGFIQRLSQFALSGEANILE